MDEGNESLSAAAAAAENKVLRDENAKLSRKNDILHGIIKVVKNILMDTLANTRKDLSPPTLTPVEDRHTNNINDYILSCDDRSASAVQAITSSSGPTTGSIDFLPATETAPPSTDDSTGLLGDGSAASAVEAITSSSGQ
jgi:hypothetical protein